MKRGAWMMKVVKVNPKPMDKVASSRREKREGGKELSVWRPRVEDSSVLPQSVLLT